MQLLLNLSVGPENNADGITAFFDEKFSGDIGNEDSYKFTNLDENLAISYKGISLSMEGRPAVTSDDTIPLQLWQLRQQNYYLRLTASNFSPGVTAFVKDSYLQQETPIDLLSDNLLAFSVDTTISASFANRFTIVFKAGSALPVTLTDVKAYKKDKGIQVEWTARTEVNIDRYEVEKSMNGQQFDKVFTESATVNNAVTKEYSWLDENANAGDNFYRVKVIEKSGTVKYSNVVKVNIAEGKGSLTIFPNPIKDNQVRVQFTNMEKGRYSAVLYNNLGQRLYSSPVEHTGRSGAYTIAPGRSISKGTYTLQISKGGSTVSERVIVE